MRLTVFYGMMKSGNHAIIKWVFENALRQFITEDQIQTLKLGYNENSRIGNAIAFYNDVVNNPVPPSHMVPCKITLMSIEEEYHEIPVLKDVKWESVHKVFLFRNLKNMVASRKRSKEYSVKFFGNTQTMCNKWKKLNDAYTKIKSKFPETTHRVSYDELVVNGDSNLIENLGMKKFLEFRHIPRIISNNHKPGWSSFPGNDKFNERFKALSEEDNKYIDEYIKKHIGETY